VRCKHRFGCSDHDRRDSAACCANASTTGPHITRRRHRSAGVRFDHTGSTGRDRDTCHRQPGELFGFFDDATGEFIAQVPAIADITVLDVFAGEEPFYLFDGC
jgi:hypothetical protein